MHYILFSTEAPTPGSSTYWCTIPLRQGSCTSLPSARDWLPGGWPFRWCQRQTAWVAANDQNLIDVREPHPHGNVLPEWDLLSHSQEIVWNPVCKSTLHPSQSCLGKILCEGLGLILLVKERVCDSEFSDIGIWQGGGGRGHCAPPPPKKCQSIKFVQNLDNIWAKFRQNKNTCKFFVNLGHFAFQHILCNVTCRSSCTSTPILG